MRRAIEKIIGLRLNAHNLRVLFAEFIGTCMIVLFGCGSVCSSLSGAYKGIWQIAVVWGLGVSFAIYCTAAISNAHLNPAVSWAFFLWRPHGTFKLQCIGKRNKTKNKKTKIVPTQSSSAPGETHNGERKRDVGLRSRKRGTKCIVLGMQQYLDLLPSLLMYSVSQLIGSIVGGMLNLVIYETTIASFEVKNNITRGDEKSILTAKAFGEYFPNPDLSVKYGGTGGIYEQTDVSLGHGLFIEAWGTFILVFVIFVLTNVKNGAVKMKFGREGKEDMDKNMYCVCIEIDEKDKKLDQEESNVLLEKVEKQSSQEGVSQIEQISIDKKCCTSVSESTPTSIAISKLPTTASRRNVSETNICHPISIGHENKSYPNMQSIPSVVIPGLIGFTVAMLLALYAPLTQAGWNPARDFGPRIVAYFAGWGKIAIPGPRYGFWIYIVGPYIGATFAGFFSEKIFYGFKA